MQTLAALAVTDHIQDLQREAESARLAHAAGASKRGLSGWRRRGGAAARQLSGTLESIALRLDPTVCRPSYGRE